MFAQDHDDLSEQIRTLPTHDLIRRTPLDAGIGILFLNDSSKQTLEKLIHFEAQPFGADPLGVHDEVDPEFVLGTQGLCRSNAVLQVRNRDCRFETFEPLCREKLFDQALQEVRAAFVKGLRCCVALEQGDDSSGNVLGVDLIEKRRLLRV